MNGIDGVVKHRSPSNYNKNIYKIIFNKADIRGNEDVSGKDIITSIVTKRPIVEVWINVEERKLIKVQEMPVNIMYENIPVAVY